MAHLSDKNIKDIIKADQEGKVQVFNFENIDFVITTKIAYERDTKTRIYNQ